MGRRIFTVTVDGQPDNVAGEFDSFQAAKAAWRFVGRPRDSWITEHVRDSDGTYITIRTIPLSKSDDEYVPGHMRETDRSDRPISMSYGELPPFSQFERDIRRPDPDSRHGAAYWPRGTTYPMELVDANEIALAEDFMRRTTWPAHSAGDLVEFEPERRRTGRHGGVRGFKGTERAIYNFLEYLVEASIVTRGRQGGDEYDEAPSNLASSIMTTLGYEWI